MSTNGTVVGQYPSTGTSTAAAICAGAFTNHLHLDLIQVINEGGECVWNLTYLGVSNTNPSSPTTGPNGKPLALLTQLFGTNLAAAVGSGSGASNKQNLLDILQIYSKQGGNLLLHVSNTGTVTTP